MKPAIGTDTAHYGVNGDFVNDPAYPRWRRESYIEWEEWQDGTPNTPTITVNGESVKNPDYTAHSGFGSSGIREGVQIIRSQR